MYFFFYGQARTFGTPSCSGGGSTESLCSSTADSACGHPPDLPDDGNLATPGPPHGVDVSYSAFKTKVDRWHFKSWWLIRTPPWEETFNWTLKSLASIRRSSWNRVDGVKTWAIHFLWPSSWLTDCLQLFWPIRSNLKMKNSLQLNNREIDWIT